MIFAHRPQKYEYVWFAKLASWWSGDLVNFIDILSCNLEYLQVFSFVLLQKYSSWKRQLKRTQSTVRTFYWEIKTGKVQNKTEKIFQEQRKAEASLQN